MKFAETNLFQLASSRLQWLSDRQSVISENIANADVAEYQARDVESFESYLGRTKVGAGLPRADVIATESLWKRDGTGNNVVLEEQIMKAGTTSSDYRVAASLYRKAHEMMLSVAGRR